MNQTEINWKIRDVGGLNIFQKAILNFINSRGGECYDSQTQMADHIGTSQTSINRWLKNLEDMDFIEMMGRGKRGKWTFKKPFFDYISNDENIIQSESKLFRENNNSGGIIHRESQLFTENNDYSERITIIPSEYPSKEESKREKERIKERGNKRARTNEEQLAAYLNGEPARSFPPSGQLKKISFREKTTIEQIVHYLCRKYPTNEQTRTLIESGVTDEQLNQFFGKGDPGPDVWWWKRPGSVWQRDKNPNQPLTPNLIAEYAPGAMTWEPTQPTTANRPTDVKINIDANGIMSI